MTKVVVLVKSWLMVNSWDLGAHRASRQRSLETFCFYSGLGLATSSSGGVVQLFWGYVQLGCLLESSQVMLLSEPFVKSWSEKN